MYMPDSRSSRAFLRPGGSIGHASAVCIRAEYQNQGSLSPFGPHQISALVELTLGDAETWDPQLRFIHIHQLCRIQYVLFFRIRFCKH